NLRRALGHPGRDFQYVDAGFGPVRVGPSFTPDSEWGPRPTHLEFTPFNAITAHVKYKIVVCIPDHCKGAKTRGAFSMVDYAVAFEENEHGYTRVRHEVVAEIPLSQTAAGRVPDSIDEYREQLAPPV